MTERELQEKREAQARHRFYFLVVLLTIILALLLGIVFFWLTMPSQGAEGGVFSVSEIHVKGNSVYHEEAVVAQSGVYKGQSIFAVNSNDAEKAIREAFPYYETVEVQTVNMREVHITVTETEVVAAVYANGHWVLVGKNGMALEECEITSDRPKRLMLIEGGVPPEGGIKVGAPVMDVYSWAIAEKLLDAIRVAEFQDITRVDLSDISDLKVYWRDQIEVRLGNDSNLEYELRVIAHDVLPKLTASHSENVTGVLDISSYSNPDLQDQTIFTPSSLLATTTTAPRPTLVEPESDQTSTTAVSDPVG
ncbi:MAG: FtsQ-type POTRA domain-containing protein [Clostridia bacterium]|nr:FtsQ-type POTRA domain-containing protein [Clostridia bacterium]